MIRHIFLHVMTQYAHAVTHVLHVTTHILHVTTHAKPPEAAAQLASEKAGSVWI